MRDRALVNAVRAALADPVDVCRRLGLAAGARRQRCGMLVRCPAHDDRDPSCSVRVGGDGTIAVKCHACGFSGDVLHLVAAIERLDIERDFGAVLRRAVALAHVDEHRAQLPSRPRAESKSREPPRLPDDRFAAVVGPLLYAGRLDGGDAARDVNVYLAGRGVLGAAHADGWAALPPPELQPTLMRVLFDAAEPSDGYAPPFTRAEVRTSGLLDGARFAHPAARVLIPWRDPAGRVANLQRRRIDAGEPRYVGPRGRAFIWPYGIERLATAPTDVPIAIVEGAIDVLALRAQLAAQGETVIVLGIPGLSGWRPTWGELARGRLAAVAIDADEAGEKNVMQIAQDCAIAGARRVERWTPPAKDWAASIRKEAAS